MEAFIITVVRFASLLRPIIINASHGFLHTLSWTLDDAIQEARILIWQLVKKHRYRPTEPGGHFLITGSEL